MHKFITLFLTLLFAVATTTWGSEPAARNQSSQQRTTTITDAAGRVHERAAMRTTHAQRAAVAKRQAKARRMKAEQMKKQGVK